MDISYPTRIVTGSYNGILKETVEYYNELITYLLHIINKEQTEIIIKDVDEHENERQMRLEALIHATKNNEHPKYEDFDKEFPQLPSYIRRAAEKKAIGIYKSGTQTTSTGNSPARKEPNPGSNTSTTPHSPSTTRTPTARTARKAITTSN